MVFFLFFFLGMLVMITNHESSVIGSGTSACGDQKKQMNIGGLLQGSKHGIMIDEIW